MRIAVCRSIALLLLPVACAHSSASSRNASTRDKANAALATRELNAAYALYSDAACEAVAEDPQAPQAAELARTSTELWEALGRPDDLPKCLTACTLPEPLHTFVQALSACAMANWHRAAALLDQAADQPAPPLWQAEIAMRQALVAMHTGQSRAARSYLCTAQQAAPRIAEVRLFAAQTHLHQNDPNAAIDALRPLLAMAPNPVDLGRARALVERAIDTAGPPLTPADLAATQELMETLQGEQGIDPSELPHTRMLVSTAPHPRVLTLAGLLALRLGATSQGVDWLERAQAQNPLDPGPQRILAGHYVANHENLAAVAALRQACHKNPFDAEMLTELARNEALVGDIRAAAQTTATLLVLEPNVPRHVETQARLTTQLRDQAALRDSPPVPRVRLWPAPQDTPEAAAACD